MARKAKPPAASAPVFSAAKWASLDETFERVANALGSSDLAERDLPEDMQSGRLPVAMRRISPDGVVDTFELVEPSFLQEVGFYPPSEDDPHVEVYGLDAKLTAGVYLYLFVARKFLDRLYPVSHAVEPAADAPAMTSDAPPRHKPGPRPIKDWQTVVARELIRRGYAGEKKPTPSAMVRFCEKTIDHSPDLSDMAKWLKQLL